MTTITMDSLRAMLPMMLLPGILLSAEPERKNTAPPPGTTGVPGRPSRFANDPRPAKKIVYKEVGGWELALHVFEPAGQQPTARRPAIVFFHGGAWDEIKEPLDLK
jgi:acetyl esterase/lipase